ncbi:GNAT family N-acetyltransferase [Alteribacillus iranensis]|uniref:Riboflavin biosynthesis RibT protein n=1 Tax=Alteribacillus iranensis TaxID=930128 RepID=A0A1I1ZLJ4_9BACI|nr:GNAT family N-acetyltransferase [Alteribacillus iranensis]SFE32587.1 riboflavin biosynthesis RibT protein [Alteribacillus iranensis]
MFIKYKPAYKKIAMGLLSYMPEQKDVKDLQDTIACYEENNDWQLYLWKENEDIIGVLGLYHRGPDVVELKHICVNPSYREEGIGKEMVHTIKERLDAELIPCEETAAFLGTCQRDKEQPSPEQPSKVSG